MKIGSPYVVLFTILAGCAKAPAPEPAAPEVVAEVSVATALARPLPTTVEVNGQFVPREGHVARVGATLPNRIATVTVKEGDRVVAGMVVATLDTLAQTATARQMTEAAAAAESEYQTNLRVAQLQLETAIAEAASDISQANSNLKIAQADFARVKSGNRPQEIAAAQTAVQQAIIARDQARRELSRVQALLKEGFIAAKEVEAARETLASEEQAVVAAENALDLARIGSRPEDIAAAEERVKAAKDSLATIKVTAAKRIAAARATAEGAQQAVSSVYSKRSEAASATATAETSLIRAPFSGIVTKRILNPGDESDNLTPILEITDASQGLDFVAMLSAVQASGIRVGYTASISVESISVKGQTANIGNADPATGLIPVRIAIPVHGSIRSGTFGRGLITIPASGNVVVIPSIAVLDREGQSIVLVQSGDLAKVVPVTTGARSGNLIAIQSGLKPGQKVITDGQYELTDGAKVRVKAP